MKSTIKISREQVANVFKEYETITALTNDQENQSSNRIYKVTDASLDPNLTFPVGETKKHAYYEYKETPNSDIGDYDLIGAPFADGGNGDGCCNNPPNTFIGNAGAKLKTAASLAERYDNLTEADIQNFHIDNNNNISCYIEKEYRFVRDAFRDSYIPGISYYIDIEGKASLQSLNLPVGDPNDSGGDPNLFRGNSNNVIILPKFNQLSYNTFAQGSYDLISIPQNIPIGRSEPADSVFLSSSFNGKVYVNIANETINEGNPDGDLLGTNVASWVKYSTNSDAPNRVDEISVSGKTKNTINIVWDAIVHTNAIDWYLIFVDGNYVGKTNSEFFEITGLNPLTSYAIKILVIDEMGNNSVFSNEYEIITESDGGGGDQDLDSVLEKGNISDNLIKLEHPSGSGNLSEYNKANLIFTEGAPNPPITQYGFKRIESSRGSDFLRIWLYDDQNEQMTGRGTIYFPKLSTNSTERTLVTSVGGVVADADGNVPFSIGSGGHELSKIEVEDETSTVFGTISGLRWFQAFTKHIAAWWAGITIAIADVVGLQNELDGKADKTTKIEGAGAIEGGGTLAANRTLDLTQATKDDIAEGVTANGWGDHSSAGYQLASNIRQNLSSPNATTYPSTQAVHDALLAGIPKEEKITGTRYTNTSASGVLTFDMDSYKVFDLILTGNTDFQIQNPPTGTETKVIEGLVTGDFGIGLPSDWVPFPNNDDYIGSMTNHIVVTFIKSGYGGIFYSLQNIILNE